MSFIDGDWRDYYRMKTEIDGKTVYFGWSEDDIRSVVSRKMKPIAEEADREYKEMIEEHIRCTICTSEENGNSL